MTQQYVNLMAWIQTLQFNETEEGQGMVEYALILVLISVVAIVTMRILGTTVAGKFTDITNSLNGKQQADPAGSASNQGEPRLQSRGSPFPFSPIHPGRTFWVMAPSLSAT